MWILILVTLFQVYVMNNILLLGFINPYPYIMFLILLPVSIPGWILLVLAFVNGLFIDWFSHTGGIHAFSTLVTGFIRPSLIRFLSRDNDIEPWFYPSIKYFGRQRFFNYALIMVCIHHVVLSFIINPNLKIFIGIIPSTLISIAITLTIILSYQLLVSNRKNSLHSRNK